MQKNRCMPDLVRLSALIEAHGLHLGNVCQQLCRSQDLRDAVGAVKLDGMWFVDATLISSFIPSDWNSYGERREEIDHARYTRVVELDQANAKIKRTCFLLSQSETIQEALGMRTFNGFRSRYIENELLESFDPNQWFYCPEQDEWLKDDDVLFLPLTIAVRNLPNKNQIIAKFRLNPKVRVELGAVRYPNDFRWWVDLQKLANFDSHLWPYHGEKREQIVRDEPAPPSPRSFDKRILDQKEPGTLTSREVAWLLGWDKNKLRKRLTDSEFQDRIGASKSESGHWFFDERKLKENFGLPLHK